MTVWEAQHCDNTSESGFMTISIHRTKTGAEKAVAESKAEILDDNFESDEFNDWNVVETEVLE